MIRPLNKHILATLLLLVQAALLSGQGEWNLKEDKEGIAIYSRENPFSDFNEFRATTTATGSIRAFEAVLRDVAVIPDWMYSVKSSRLLETRGDSVVIYYTEAKSPFPFKNRDGIYLNRYRPQEDGQVLWVGIEILPEYLEEEDDMVRISRGKGHWEARQTGPDRLEIDFQMQVDPGGSIPAWLANMFVVDTPFETLSALKEMMGKEKYRKAAGSR